MPRLQARTLLHYDDAVMKRRLALLPNCLIIGAAKAGTTTLYDLLRAYPGVYFPVEKEPAFFCDDDHYQKGLDWYVHTFFRNSGGMLLRGEATPRYLFWGKKVAPRLMEAYGNDLPKLIVIFREPAALVYSNYWQNVRQGSEDLPFREALLAESARWSRYGDELAMHGRIDFLYSQLANYASQLQVYLSVFPRENFLFLLHEDLGDFSNLAARLEVFLGLRARSWEQPVRSNRASLPRSRSLHNWLVRSSRSKDFIKSILPYTWRYRAKDFARRFNLREIQPPVLDPEIKKQLQHQYADQVRQLEVLTQRDLSSWYVAS